MTPFDEPGALPPSWLIEVPLAHRGLHGDEVPENSLAAFAAAAEAGYGAELDVHLSADGEVMVVHDVSLERVAGVARPVGDLTAAELGELSLHGTDERIPTLATALHLLRHVPVMVELKTARLRPGPLEQRVAEVLAPHPGPVCVASFNPVPLRWLRRHHPRVVRVQTATDEPIPGVPSVLVRRLADLRDVRHVAPAAVSYQIRGLPRPAVDAWRGRGGVVVTWTVDDATSLRKAATVADNLIFEHVRPDPWPPSQVEEVAEPRSGE